MRRTSVLAEGQNLGAGGIHFRRAFEINRVEAASGGRNPKKKDILSDVLLFWRSGRDSNPRAVARKLISRGVKRIKPLISPHKSV